MRRKFGHVLVVSFISLLMILSGCGGSEGKVENPTTQPPEGGSETPGQPETPPIDQPSDPEEPSEPEVPPRNDDTANPSTSTPVALIVRPDISNVFVGDTLQLIATIENDDGSLFSATQGATWQIQNNTGAVVNTAGQFQASQEGQYQVTASVQNFQETVTIRVEEQVVVEPTGFTIRFVKPADWNDSVNIYLWKEGGGEKPRGDWPGESLRATDTGIYETEILFSELDGSTAKLIFNDGSKQTNNLTRSSAGVYEDGAWRDLEQEVVEQSYELAVDIGSGSGNYKANELVNISAPSMNLGRRFSHWEGSGKLQILDLKNTDTSILMPDAETQVYPVYKGTSLLFGKQQFETHCARCHGDDGKGSPGIFPSLHLCTSCTDDSLASRIQFTMPPVNASATHGPADCVGDCAASVAEFILDEFTGEDSQTACEVSRPIARGVRLLTEREYRNSIIDLFGLRIDQLPDSEFLTRVKVNGFDNNREVGIVSPEMFDAAYDAAKTIVSSAQKSRYLTCSYNTNAQCIVDDFAPKVFRRPLSRDEQSRYKIISEERGVDAAIAAMLASSSFLYRTELGGDNITVGDQVTLNSYEIASLISYAVAGTTPDQALLTAASNNELVRPASRVAHAERLLLSDEAKNNYGHFISSWLGSSAILSVNKKESHLTPSIRQAMLDETEDFAAHVAFDASGKYAELLSANYTVVNDELARYYGLNKTGVTTALPANTRAGLLGHASLLATSSSYDQTSPIKRGVFVRNKLLCQVLPDPPDDVEVFVPEKDPSLTTRERFALHTANPVCFTCHQYIDDLGFGFESFDTYGRYRTTENGKPIDDRGNINNLESLADENTPAYFEGVAELGAKIAESQSGKACYVKNYYRFAYGVEESGSDECEIDRLALSFEQSGGDLKSLILDVVESEQFILRGKN